jgi:hypothetical protein
MEKALRERTALCFPVDAGAARLAAGGRTGGEGEGPVQARLSNLPHYAVTGVKAQAFVRVLFLSSAVWCTLRK